MKYESRLKELFGKYMESQCTHDELKELMQLVRDQQSDEDMDEPMTDLWEQLRDTPEIMHVNWDAMYANIAEGSRISLPEKTRRVNWAGSRIWYYAAAVLIATISFMAYDYIAPGPESMLTMKGERQIWLKTRVPLTETKVLLLKDGSRVTLNSGSSLKYPKAFTSDRREVYLDGEGFFEIARDTEHPFIVHSGKLKTQVLGTKFNVRTYPSSPKMDVTVLSGKVAVEKTDSGDTLHLTANQVATLDAGTQSFEKSEVVNAEESVAWKEGILVFEDASLEEVSASISRKFGTKVMLADKGLERCRISAVFKRQSLTEILRVISRITGVTYKKKDDVYLISGKGCD